MVRQKSLETVLETLGKILLHIAFHLLENSDALKRNNLS